MKQSEFRRYLASLGATFTEGGHHTKIHLNGRQSVMPRHPSKELAPSVLRAIRKQLDI
ncbi:MAG: type II toxin-antitoxin system HicA family toxin [Zoogloeaceae bacterium]|nr:type II toxin-antitoxin system HicA family toxin [Zoogloeaceae bacterium]